MPSWLLYLEGLKINGVLRDVDDNEHKLLYQRETVKNLFLFEWVNGLSTISILILIWVFQMKFCWVNRIVEVTGIILELVIWYYTQPWVVTNQIHCE